MDGRTRRVPGVALLTVLLGAVGVGPLLLYGLSATSDTIIGDLHISEAQFGLLATVCFGCAAIGNVTLARFADRRSDIALMTLVFALAAAALAVATVPAGYWMLLVAVGLSGLAQSFPNGVTNRILLERVPTVRRIGWVGIKQSGVQVSQLVASLAFPLLALAFGWRGAALVTALVPLALMLMAWRSLHATPLLPHVDAGPADTAGPSAPTAGSAAPTAGSAETAAAGAASSESAPVRPPSHPGRVWALAAYGLLNGIGQQATNVYLPLFAVRELDFSLILGGVTAAVAGVVGVIARVGWARQMARGSSGPKLLLVLAVIALIGAAMFLSALATGWSALLWIAVAMHGTSALGVSVVLMSVLMRFIPSASMASASGVVTAGMFAGFSFGPFLMGLLISSSGGFAMGWSTVGFVYLLCLILAAVLIGTGRRAR